MLPLINFLNIANSEEGKYQVVINSLESDSITPTLKNISNRFKEAELNELFSYSKKEGLKHSIRRLQNNKEFIVELPEDDKMDIN